MKKSYVIFAAAILMSASACPQAKPCEELKSDIARKLEANGVKSYSLEILEKDKGTQGKVIGTCAGGTKKIIYSRTETSAPKSTAGTGKR